jgi:hypothetical protein
MMPTLDYLCRNPDFGSDMLSNVVEDMDRFTREDAENRQEVPIHTATWFTRDVTSLLIKVKEAALLVSC